MRLLLASNYHAYDGWARSVSDKYDEFMYDCLSRKICINLIECEHPYIYSNSRYKWERHNIYTVTLGVNLNVVKPQVKQHLIDNVGCIIMQGGNTFHISQLVHKNGWDMFIVDAVRKGIPYIGYSAGAIMATPTVMSAQWADFMPKNFRPKSMDIFGLDFVDYCIKPHANMFLPKYNTEFKTFAQRENRDMYCIMERGAIVVDDKYSVRWLTEVIEK